MLWWDGCDTILSAVTLQLLRCWWRRLHGCWAFISLTHSNTVTSYDQFMSSPSLGRWHGLLSVRRTLHHSQPWWSGWSKDDFAEIPGIVTFVWGTCRTLDIWALFLDLLGGHPGDLVWYWDSIQSNPVNNKTQGVLEFCTSHNRIIRWI